jgi:hypothetical protein
MRKFDTLIILTALMRWKQSNARVFGNTREQCSGLQLADRIRNELRVWEVAMLGVGGRQHHEREGFRFGGVE